MNVSGNRASNRFSVAQNLDQMWRVFEQREDGATRRLAGAWPTRDEALAVAREAAQEAGDLPRPALAIVPAPAASSEPAMEVPEGDLVPFDFGGAPLRSLVDGDGNPWFVAADVTSILGYVNASSAIVRHVDDEDVTRATIAFREGSRVVPRPRPIINESGLYSLMLSSHLPEARRFRRWVTSEVLPTLRRTGSYSTQQQAPDLSGRELIARAVLEAQQIIAAQDAQIEVLTERIDTWEDLSTPSHETQDLGTVGKMLGVGRTNLFRFLRDQRILIATGQMRNTPYARYAHHFEVRYSEHITENGTLRRTPVTHVKPSGIAFIRKRLRDHSAPSKTA